MTYRQAMYEARLEANANYLAERFNTDSVQYQHYRNLYIKGRICWSDFIKYCEQDLSVNLIAKKGNGSYTRVIKQDDFADLAACMSTVRR